MQEIKSEKDILIIPRRYFHGMTSALEALVRKIEIKDFETMERLLYLRDWLDAAKVDRETRNMYPTVRWDNIHLLLPQEEHLHPGDTSQKANEPVQQQCQ